MSEDHNRLTLPANADFWVFGYGSLMWKPGFPHVEVRHARVRGYHRRLCVRSIYHRGTPDRPGLVFGLDRGGSCRGLAYRVPAAEGETAMEYLYRRELVTSAYRPAWVTLESAEGGLRAAGFVVDRTHQYYAGHLDPAELAAIVVRCQGESGHNRDYLVSTVRHLEALGLGDPKLRHLLDLVEAMGGDVER